MSYLVLARKYRPKVFADVAGQEHVTRTLANALLSGRVAHAYLFAGARGVGKTTVARILAMAVNCRAEEDRPCGVCDSCVEISEGQAVDVFEIDGASNRGIDEIRDLRETVKYLPSKSAYKVYIIDEVHMLTIQAFNALLKTLEEPPAHVIFIFATTEAHKVPPTILSRCQRYDFKRIPLADIVARVEEIAASEGVRIGPGPVRLIARESEGSLRDALSLFDQVITFAGAEVSEEIAAEALGLADQALISSLARALLAGDAGQALDLLDQVYNYGHDLKDFATQVLEYFRALIVAKVSGEPEKVLEILDAELGEIKEIAAGASLETLNYFFQALLSVQDPLRRSTHPRLVFEALLVRLAQVEPVQPLAELTARLESLLGAAGPGKQAAPPARAVKPARAGAPAGPPPGAAAAEAAPESHHWGGFLTLVRQENPILLSFLEQAQVKEFSPERVEIQFAQNGLAELVDQDKLRGLLSQYLGRRPGLKVTVFSPAGPEAAAEAPPSDRRRKLKEELLNHPLVREACEVLAAEVVDVVPET